LTFLPSPPWGRGWLAEAFSSAEARRGPHVLSVVGVRGFYPLTTLIRDTTLALRFVQDKNKEFSVSRPNVGIPRKTPGDLLTD